MTLFIIFIILCIAAFVYIHTLGGGHILKFKEDTPNENLNGTDTSSVVNITDTSGDVNITNSAN